MKSRMEKPANNIELKYQFSVIELKLYNEQPNEMNVVKKGKACYEEPEQSGKNAVKLKQVQFNS